jgi:predicted dehydrogenase
MIRVGIAGFGKIGQARAKEIELIDGVEIVAIYDIHHPTGSYSYKLTDSFEELLTLIDVLFVCTYNDVLAKFTELALRQNIHVFCEKPPARTVKELEKVISAEERSHSILKYGFNHRYHYSVMEAKRIIDSGDMGKLLLMRGVYGKAGSIDYDKNWRNFKKLSGGGILIDQGIHMLDLMIYFNGQNFNKVQGKIFNSFWNVEAEDNAFIILESNNGVVASMHSSATQWRHKFLLEMIFEEGYINLDGFLSSTRSYAPETLVTARREFEDITFAMGKPKETVINFENDDSFKMEVLDFLNAIKSKGTIKHGKSKDALAVLSLIENIYKESEFFS